MTRYSVIERASTHSMFCPKFDAADTNIAPAMSKRVMRVELGQPSGKKVKSERYSCSRLFILLAQSIHIKPQRRRARRAVGSAALHQSCTAVAAPIIKKVTDAKKRDDQDNANE